MAALVGTAPVPAASTAPAFNRAAWLADYDGLKRALANGYANMDWQIERRGFSPVRADAAIRAMLDKANSDVEATLVMTRLVEGLDDPHVVLLPGPPPAGATLLPRQSQAAPPTAMAAVCKAAGYRPARGPSRLGYARAPGFAPVGDGPFEAGHVGALGFLRIPSFAETSYADACAAVARPGLAGRDLQLAVRAELNRQLVATIDALKAGGIHRLAIDLARNGGGSEWSEEVAALLSGVPLTREEPRRVGPACDRSGLWEGKSVCPIYAGPATRQTIAPKGAWTGPLSLLVDRDTASAAEELVTLLRSRPGVTVVGDRTKGAGCGYMDGGAAFAFTAAPIHLMFPNCSRMTAAGVNEIEGLMPDRAVSWPATAPEAIVPLLSR